MRGFVFVLAAVVSGSGLSYAATYSVSLDLRDPSRLIDAGVTAQTSSLNSFVDPLTLQPTRTPGPRGFFDRETLSLALTFEIDPFLLVEGDQVEFSFANTIAVDLGFFEFPSGSQVLNVLLNGVADTPLFSAERFTGYSYIADGRRVSVPPSAFDISLGRFDALEDGGRGSVELGRAFVGATEPVDNLFESFASILFFEDRTGRNPQMIADSVTVIFTADVISFDDLFGSPFSISSSGSTFINYDEDYGVTGVPLPGSIFLLLTSMLGVVAWKRSITD